MQEPNEIPFSGVDERLRHRWNRMLRTLTERSEEFWLELAVGALRKKEYDDALVNLYQALKINPRDGRSLRLKGMILQYKALDTFEPEPFSVQIRTMFKAYQETLDVRPSLRENVEKRLKHVYFATFKRGLQAFEKGAIKKSSFGVAATYFELAALIRSGISSEMPKPDTPWGAYVNLALSHFNAGSPLEAMEALEMALLQGDTAPTSYQILAGLHLEQGLPERAVEFLERACFTNEGGDWLYPLLANAYVQSDQIDAALSIYKDIVAQKPEDHRIRYNYGTLLLENEAYEAAAKELLIAAELDPNDARTHHNLGAVFFNWAMDFENPVKQSNSGPQPTQASSSETSKLEVQMVAWVEEQKALYKRAIPHLEKARRLTDARGEDSFSICRSLYIAYRNVGQPDKAEMLVTNATFERKETVPPTYQMDRSTATF